MGIEREEYRACNLCPRACGVDRLSGQRGVCGMTAAVRLARAALHFWEEPPISAYHGSGTVFFSGCPLKCAYCQNASISQGEVGKEVSIERLTEIFLELEGKGALNINLVTPTHFVPSIKRALDGARALGLNLPVVYNTSGYESVQTIEGLNGYVDIFLTDFKYWSAYGAKRYSAVSDYAERAMEALSAMLDLVGPYTLSGTFDKADDAEEDDEPIETLAKGVVVRHLLLPGYLEDAKKIVRYVYEQFGDDVALSLMSQYTPLGTIAQRFPELGNEVDLSEYEQLLDYTFNLGATNVFYQIGECASESFIPDFDYEGV